MKKYRTNNVQARNGVQIGTGWHVIYLAADVEEMLRPELEKIIALAEDIFAHQIEAIATRLLERLR